MGKGDSGETAFFTMGVYVVMFEKISFQLSPGWMFVQ